MIASFLYPMVKFERIMANIELLAIQVKFRVQALQAQ
jgi:hypothetical protein